MQSQTILNMRVAVSTLSTVVQQVIHFSRREGGTYICVSNVHMCMEMFDDQKFENIVNGADLVIADGKPISVAQKMFGHKNAEQVRGQDIMNEICALSGKENLIIGFYGGSSDALLSLVDEKFNKKI